MDGHVVAIPTIGRVVRTAHRLENDGEEPISAGVLVGDAHEARGRGPSAARPASEDKGYPDVTSFVRGYDRKREAESRVPHIRLRNQGQAADCVAKERGPYESLNLTGRGVRA